MSGLPPQPCIVCGGTDTSPSIFGGYRFLGDRYYRQRCARCGFIFVNPIPTPAVFEKMYGDEYFEDYYGGGEDTGYAASADAGVAKGHSILNRVAPHVPSGRLLDIGCAGGYFLA